jgi:hypothetical protein
MDLRNVEDRLTKRRSALNSSGFVASSLLASVVWFLIHDRCGPVNMLGTTLIVALPFCGLMHAFWRSVGLARILANAWALLVALVVAAVVSMSFPGPALIG